MVTSTPGYLYIPKTRPQQLPLLLRIAPIDRRDKMHAMI
jgi:hypothetical protein